jgi:uncharacterized protein YndB with AHSA1/START domain
MTHPFELSQQIELAATPEQVWDAIATGPGVDSWFMGRTELGTSAGDPADLTMMGHTEQATITAYEPGTRLATRSAEAPDGQFMAMEYLIEGRGGGTTVLRLVQNGMLGDDWETEFEAMKAGWPIYLETLKQYLTYFTGRTPSSVTTVFRPGAGGPDAVWKIVTESLGVTPDVAEGDEVRLRRGRLLREPARQSGRPDGRGPVPVHPRRHRPRRRPRARPPELRGPRRAGRVGGLDGRALRLTLSSFIPAPQPDQWCQQHTTPEE